MCLTLAKSNEKMSCPGGTVLDFVMVVVPMENNCVDGNLESLHEDHGC